MNSLKLTKSCIIVIIAAILAVLMLVCTFVGNSTTLEYMEELEFSGILLWIYYITFSVTILFSISQKQDFAKLAAIINLSAITLTIVVMLIDFGSYFFNWIDIGVLGCLLASLIALISVVKVSKSPNC